MAVDRIRELRAVGDVRGIGLLWGLEFVADQRTKQPFQPELNFAGQVAQAAVKRGLLVYPMQGCVDGTAGDHLLIAPPAVITRDQIDSAVERLSDSIQEVSSQIA
jgi:adenosylmethionine-8-amino-7-oxononanoate aminotransferase